MLPEPVAAPGPELGSVFKDRVERWSRPDGKQRDVSTRCGKCYTRDLCTCHRGTEEGPQPSSWILEVIVKGKQELGR